MINIKNGIFTKFLNIFKSNLYAFSLYSRQIAGTIILFVIARYLSVYDYGLFSSYKAISITILILTCLGYNEYILISSKKNVCEVRLKIGFFIINAIAIILIAAGLSLFCPLERHFIFVLVLFRTFFDTTFFTLILPYFQASNKFNIISYINITYGILVFIITLISYIFKLSLSKFLLLSCTIGLINFIQCSLCAGINYLSALLNIKKYFKLLDKSIFTYISSAALFIFFAQIPNLYVSAFVQKEEAALYFSVATISGIITLLVSAQYQKIVPELMNSSRNIIKQILKKNIINVTVINLIIFILFCFTGKYLLHLIYGQEYYSKGYLILLIYTISNISFAFATIFGAYITASGNQKTKVKTQIVATFIVFLMLYLLHQLGIYGASISYLVAITYIGIVYCIKTKQLLKK